MYQRRRRTVLLAVLLVSAITAAASLASGTDQPAAKQAGQTGTSGVSPERMTPLRAAPTVARPSAAATTSTRTAATRTTGTRPVRTAPRAAAGLSYATGAGPVLGTAGSVRRFRVAVERNQDERPADFAAAVERILGDPRSWIGSRQVRLQRVPRAAAAEFTIFLASAATSERMCAVGGLNTEGFTSCRLPGKVIINLDRWRRAVPNYGAPLATYQAYAINHEVGHQLGHGHEACPGAGKLAPVMQQQTYGLKGCLANPWPYVDGRRYAGPPVA